MGDNARAGGRDVHGEEMRPVWFRRCRGSRDRVARETWHRAAHPPRCARSEPPKARPDAIIVLGAGFYGDTLSIVLKARLDTALLLHRRYPAALLVLSGGKGAGENRTEASLMREYLLRRGLPDNLLLPEPEAMDTVQNFANSKRLLDARFGAGLYRGAFITSEFHLYRSRRLAARAGFSTACYGADTLWCLLPAYLTRETVAILHDLVF